VAAFIVEPVQGEGGFHVAPTEFLEALRALADQHGILLIADEVQAGFARTGKLFGIEHSGVEPDLVAWPSRWPPASARRADRPRAGHGRARSRQAWAAPMADRRSAVRRRWPCLR
jgi:hypothetical protein